MSELEVEPSGEAEFGPCECCGALTRRVWGFVHRAGETEAAYFVEWTPGPSPHDATFDLIVGRWGEDACASDRVAVSLLFRWTEDGGQFMVVDASGRPNSDPGMAARAMTRAEVIGTLLAERAFAVVDAVWLRDERIRTLTRSPSGSTE